MKLFNLDLHISVISDFENICQTLSDVEITRWSISGHNHIMGLPTPDVKHINQHTWAGINEKMIENFCDHYREFLMGFDGFVVTHTPVFALIFERFNKPILVINSCRYDQPYCWSKRPNNLDEGLRRMFKRRQLKVVSNNLNDYYYLKDRVGIESYIIPSLCLYTGASYFPTRTEVVVAGDRKLFPMHSGLVEMPKGHTWKDLYSYKAIVHVPYEMSTMSLFEQYWAGVPLFFPTKRLYKECVMSGKMNFTSLYGKRPTLDDMNVWVDRADWIILPYINYYDTLEEVPRLVEGFKDTKYVERLEWLRKNRQMVLDEWKAFMRHEFKLHI